MPEGKDAFQEFFNLDQDGKKDETITRVDASSGTKPKSEKISVDQANDVLRQEKSFKEIIKELKIKPSELFRIIDMVLEKGYYEEKYTLKGMTFVLRSKKVYSVDSITDALDAAKFISMDAVTHFSLKHQLAGSLMFFKLGKTEKVFKHNTVGDDEAVLTFLENEISAPVYAMMANKMSKFDVMVGLASHEEALNLFFEQSTD